MTDKINEEPQDAPAVVVGAPDKIWLTFGDLSEFSGCQVEYADAFRASDVSWCEEQIETSDVKYIRADLVSLRRQQPAKPLPESVEEWIHAHTVEYDNRDWTEESVPVHHLRRYLAEMHSQHQAELAAAREQGRREA